jgi:hypothetical protein
VAFGLSPWADAVTGVRKGLDVYLFLAGMMLIAEAARQEGVFDWFAALAVEHARGSPQRLFALVYAVGTVVTVFLSNDATAVVLTPAVYAATRAAGATPLPYLFVCAFIANAASFELPISNPANLVIFGGHMPHFSASQITGGPFLPSAAGPWKETGAAIEGTAQAAMPARHAVTTTSRRDIEIFIVDSLDRVPRGHSRQSTNCLVSGLTKC